MNVVKAKVVDSKHLELEKEIETAEGAWGYDVDSRDFVNGVRISNRLE